MSWVEENYEPDWKERDFRTNMAECRDCGADIVWMITINSKNIPVDLESAEDELDIDSGIKVVFNRQRGHICHFDTCEVRILKSELR